MLKNIVFDVGQVLICNDSTSFQSFLIESGTSISTVEEFSEKSNLPAFVRGQISSETFLDCVAETLSAKTKVSEIEFAWSQMFQAIPEMLELLEQLHSRYTTFLLTNTNELHWEFLKKTYHLHLKTDGALTSHEAGSVKPEPRIYALAEEHFAILPQETLLIDDMEENIRAAENRGWKGIHHVSYKETCRALASLEIIGV